MSDITSAFFKQPIYPEQGDDIHRKPIFVSYMHPQCVVVVIAGTLLLSLPYERGD